LFCVYLQECAHCAVYRDMCTVGLFSNMCIFFNATTEMCTVYIFTRINISAFTRVNISGLQQISHTEWVRQENVGMPLALRICMTTGTYRS